MFDPFPFHIGAGLKFSVTPDCEYSAYSTSSPGSMIGVHTGAPTFCAEMREINSFVAQYRRGTST